MRVQYLNKVRPSGFVNDWVDISLYFSINFGLFTNASGTLVFQQSSDKNFIDSSYSVHITQDVRDSYTVKTTSAWGRFVFTYSITPTIFRLDSIGLNYGPNSEDLWQVMSRNGLGFTSVSGFVSIANTNETDFMLMRNPANSGVLVRLSEFLLTLGATATQRSIFRFYRTPTITDVGTPMTVSKVLPTSSNTNKALMYQSPTISARGSLIQLFSVEFSTFSRNQELGRYLVQGSDLLITAQASNNNIEHSVVTVWAEELI